MLLRNLFKRSQKQPQDASGVEASLYAAIESTKNSPPQISKKAPQFATLHLKAKDALLQKNHLGMLLEANTLFCAHLIIAPNKVMIDCLSELAEQAHVKPFDSLQKELTKACVDNAVIATAFPTLKTLARPLELELFKTKELDAILQYQLEPLLPYELAQCVIDKITLVAKPPQHHFLTFSAQKRDLQEHIDAYQALNIDPEIICPKSLGLAQFAKLFFPDNQARLFIDISFQETTCLLMHRGLPLAIRSLPMGLEPQEESMSASETHLERYARELARILIGFESSYAEIQTVPIVFTGVQERDPLILSMLGKLLGYRTETIQHIPSTVSLGKRITPQDCASFAVPIGLAMALSPFQNELSKKKLSVNFRKEEFSYAKKWRRWKQDLIAYAAQMVFLALLVFLLFETNSKSVTQELQEKYASLLQLIEKTDDEVETAFATKMHVEKRAPTTTTPLSVNEIEERFSFIESTFLKRPYEEIALHPNIARVSDLLAFLSTHPAITKAPAITLESLSYSMVKRPDKDKPKEHYAVRVDLDFQASSGARARELYDALNTPNSFVDPKEEIKWNAQKGRFQTTFFLKDRTQYP